MTIHLMHNQKFIMPFIEFMNEHFDSNDHLFIIVGGVSEKEYPIKKFENVEVWEQNITRYFNIIFFFNKLRAKLLIADRIVLHSLYFPRITSFLFLNRSFLKKCYWVMWGGDFYFPEKQNWIKKQVIKHIEHFVTYIKGDYELAKKWYGATGKYHECFMYPSNLYKEYDIKPKEHDTINIQLGNSADPSNNHIDVLKQLTKYKDENIKIFVPLSYGDEEYAQEVIKYGKEIFADKFIPLTEFMPFEKYLEFLGGIDIAIFAHKRQQAMGNTITLLGLGKKVHMRSDITPWQLFKEIDVKVFDVANIEIDLIDKQTQKENQQKIKEYFSQANYLKQLQNLFESK